MNNLTENRIYRAALYVRLSKDDEKSKGRKAK
jgi:hypothetical protein